jgi:hypothetical protein
MDDMDPGGSNDQQPPSHNFIHAFSALRPLTRRRPLPEPAFALSSH